jgi:signal peptidase I
MILAGAFLLSCLWSAGRVAGSIVVVQGESMLPNFHPNDCALAKPPPEKLERGDVVVLDDGQECAIKRVVGLPGETIHLWQGQVFINRRLVHEPYLDRNTCTWPNQKLAVFILGPGQYFVMGDNRAVSLDSRTYGPVGIEQIRKTVSQSAPKIIFLPSTLPTRGELTRRPVGGRGAASYARG